MVNRIPQANFDLDISERFNFRSCEVFNDSTGKPTRVFVERKEAWSVYPNVTDNKVIMPNGAMDADFEQLAKMRPDATHISTAESKMTIEGLTHLLALRQLCYVDLSESTFDVSISEEESAEIIEQAKSMDPKQPYPNELFGLSRFALREAYMYITPECLLKIKLQQAKMQKIIEDFISQMPSLRSITMSNKITYIGTFQDGKLEGPGTLRWGAGWNSSILKGNFHEGKLIGEGFLGEGFSTSANGYLYTYKGSFFEGLRQGLGEECWHNGPTFLGQFRDDKHESGELIGTWGEKFQVTNEREVVDFLINDKEKYFERQELPDTGSDEDRETPKPIEKSRANNTTAKWLGTGATILVGLYILNNRMRATA